MSEFDDIERLATLWQTQPTRQIDVETLQRSVRRSHRRLLAMRLVEVALTVVAVLVFVPPVIAGTASPAHWLLLPYFSVFLPWVWWRTLRGPDQRLSICVESSDEYIRLRLRQIDAALSRLALSRHMALALLAYACAALVTAWLALDAGWRHASLTLIVWAAVWWLGTWVITRRRRSDLVAEREELRGGADIG